MLTLLIPCILLAYSSTCWWLGIPNDCNNVTLSNDASLSSSTLVDFTPFSFRHQLALSGNHSARLSLLCKDYLLAYFTTVQTRLLVYSATWIYLSLAGYPALLGFPIIHPFHAICHIHKILPSYPSPSVPPFHPYLSCCWHVSSPFCDIIERRACQTFKNYRQHYVIFAVLNRSVTSTLRNMQFFRWEPVPYLSVCVANLVAIRRSCWKKEEGGQTDKGTLQLYIVDGEAKLPKLRNSRK